MFRISMLLNRISRSRNLPSPEGRRSSEKFIYSELRDTTVKNATESAIENFAPFRQLALMAGGESFWQSFQNSMTGQSLNATDIDNATARVKQLISQGVSQSDAAKQALNEVRQQKTRNNSLGFGGGNRRFDCRRYPAALAQETNPEKIVSMLTQKGVDPEAAKKL